MRLADLTYEEAQTLFDAGVWEGAAGSRIWFEGRQLSDAPLKRLEEDSGLEDRVSPYKIMKCSYYIY